jgi:ribosome biogenesis GTPase A
MTRGLGKAKKSRGKSPDTHKHKSPVPRIIENLIKNVEVVLFVLDARFIDKSRNKEIEDLARKSGKKVIIVLNKSDLVDVKKIIKTKELEGLKPFLFFSAKDRKGPATLKKMIKIEAKRLGTEVVNVGVLGYPNVGKSSLINIITGRSSARTSPEAGYTKGIQKIKLSSNLYLIDTPGVIPRLEKSSSHQKYATKHSQIGAVTWHKVKYPDMVVNELMKENKGILEKYYGIDAEGDSDLLIEKLGNRLNYKKKGNVVDETRTAKKILKDWQEGKIRV